MPLMPAVSQENGQHILFAKDHEPGLYQNYLKAIEEGRADQAKKNNINADYAKATARNRIDNAVSEMVEAHRNSNENEGVKGRTASSSKH